MRPAALALLIALAPAAMAQASPPAPKQGLIDILLEYMGVRYPQWDPAGDLLYISVQRQRLFHVRGGRLLAEYPIATSSAGLGGEQDSYRTPIGLHRVAEKLGDGVPLLGILQDRAYTGRLAAPGPGGDDRDWITTRILWLQGLEPGVNSGPGVDSHERFIYIHGTANEESVGRPSSRGCIRMRNRDVVALFDAAPLGAHAVILDN